MNVWRGSRLGGNRHPHELHLFSSKFGAETGTLEALSRHHQKSRKKAVVVVVLARITREVERLAAEAQEQAHHGGGEAKTCPMIFGFLRERLSIFSIVIACAMVIWDSQ